MVSLLNLDIAGTIKAFTIDFLMKLIYYLYATLAAGVDAMQSLVRMLCGLENYAMSAMIPIYDKDGNIIDYATSTATSGDPLSNFILGVLGVGENSEVYSALNTVFWSLAVFALIILAITTMVAMVKAHYNEDSQQTNPWTYIYTAGKAIFTFAFIPIVTIIGFQLASFILQTLDNITAGAGNSSEVVELYGTSATNILKSSTDEDGKETYANYDMFGNLKPTSTTTFSGMLFNASMYGANRLRNDQVSLEQVQSTFNGLFGNKSCSAFDSLTNEGDKILYVANQVDYAFANSLAIDGSYSWDALKGVFEDSFIIGKLDPFKTNKITGFYKFHASVIWAYYDLMQFNFIVGFAGVFTTFGIMLSIVLALVSRLIKGVALFLVYPTLLGIAPMDNFKAFKSWVTNFMQQIMMAFGTIVGINLLLLILPYVQNFKFFDYEILNYMMNVIMLVVGLVMAKDFMSMISGFVGGADANQLGEGMKGEVGNKIKQGVTGGARVVGGALRIGASVATAPIRAGKKVVRGAKKVANITAAARANHVANKAARKQRKIAENQGFVKKIDDRLAGAKLDKTEREKLGISRFQQLKYKNLKRQESSRIKNQSKAIRRSGALDSLYEDIADSSKVDKILTRGEGIKNYASGKRIFLTPLQKRAMRKGKQAYEDSLKANPGNEEAAKKKQIEAIAKAAPSLASIKYFGTNALKNRNERRVKALDKEDKKKRVQMNAEIKADKISSKYGLEKNKDTGEYQFKNGNKPKLFEDNGFFKSLGKKINEGIDGMTLGRTIADSFVKTIDGVGSGLGLDKVIKAATDEMGKSLTFKGGPFKPSVSGDALQKKQHAEVLKQDKKQLDALNDIKEALKDLRNDTNKNAREARQNSNNSNGNSTP